MANVITQSFEINIKIMKIFRLYQFTNFIKIHQIQAWSFYFVCVLTITILTILNFLAEEELDIVQFNHSAMYLAESVCWFTKLPPFLLNGKKVKRCINYFSDPYFTKMVYNDKQKEIMDNCIKTCQSNSKVFLVIVVSGLINFNTKPLFWKGRRFPVELLLPFDATKELWMYVTVYLVIAAAVCYGGLVGTLIDPLMGGLALHATSQLAILKESLLSLSNYKDALLESNLEENTRNQIILKKKIEECVEHHNSILKFVNLYEECFSLPIFSQCAGSVVGVCFCCLQISMMDFMSFAAISSVVYIWIILGQVYFHCYYGSLLSDMNNSLAHGIYMSEWYHYSKPTKMSLLTIMERSQRTMVVTAGKILPLTLETFTTMLRRAYSLIAVLKNYQ